MNEQNDINYEEYTDNTINELNIPDNMDYGWQEIDKIIAKIDINYKDLSVLTTNSKELELVETFWKQITLDDDDITKLLYQVIGYSLCETAKLCKGFIFKGSGRNSKSLIFRILEAILGNEFVSHEHLENLSGTKLGSKNTVKFLRGKTVNIAEDQHQPRFISQDIITRIISGEPIAIQERGKELEPLLSKCTLLLSVNDVVNFGETGLHITDRLVVIPFRAVFTDENNNRDINIVEELCKPKTLQIITTRAIQEFKEVLKKGKFDIPDVVKEETKKYFMECNNVAEFCEIFPIKDIMIKDKYYREYRSWCSRNNKDAVSNGIFGKRVIALGYRVERYSFGNKRHNYYVSLHFNNCDSRAIYNEYLMNCSLTESLEETTTESQLEHYEIKSLSDYLWEKSLK